MLEFSHYLRQIKFFFVLLMPLLLVSCRGLSNVVPIPENQLLKQFLYGNPQGSFEYFSDVNVPADVAFARAAFTASGIDASGYSVNLIRITYLNNNLPQYALHIANSTNTKLLVYNHGHGGGLVQGMISQDNS